MKKFALFFIGLTLLLSACKKNNDYIFDQTPDERINAALAKYQAILAGAENGWKAYITVGNETKSVYGFYFKFNDSNRVKMVSDLDSTSAVILQESGYRIRQQQQPTLIFDTYSYVHVLADPNESNAGVVANVNGGPVGQGLLSDFEFIFDRDSITTDTLKLLGKVNGAQLTLIRATASEEAFFTGAQWNNQLTKYFGYLLTYYSKFTIDGKQYNISINKLDRTITFSFLDDDGNLQTHTTLFYNTPEGLILTDPLQSGTQTIEMLSLDNWNSSTRTLSLKSGDKIINIEETTFPLKIDIGASQRWLQYAIDQDSYWLSFNGFHVDGKDDAFGINTLAGYGALLYWPEYDPGFAFMGPILTNSLKYGGKFTNTVNSTTGIITFSGATNYGTYPTTGPARLTRNQFTIPEGYYFVQTSLTTYDMVSAKDGRAWISWEF